MDLHDIPSGVSGRLNCHNEYGHIPNVMHREVCACRTCGILFDMSRGGKERVAVWSADEGRVSMRKREEAFRVKTKH